MTVKNLKDRLQHLPDDARVEMDIGIKINGKLGVLSREIDSIDHHDINNLLVLHSNWPVQLFH